MEWIAEVESPLAPTRRLMVRARSASEGLALVGPYLHEPVGNWNIRIRPIRRAPLDERCRWALEKARESGADAIEVAPLS